MATAQREQCEIIKMYSTYIKIFRIINEKRLKFKFKSLLTIISQGTLLKNLPFTMLNTYMKKMKAEIINPEIEKNKMAVLVSFYINNFKKKHDVMKL